MSSLCQNRLQEERKLWRADHPYAFVAKPSKATDGPGLNLMRWDCQIPGKDGTIWEGGIYRLELQFTPDYPLQPPGVKFSPALFHPNVYPDGRVCLSILDVGPEDGWKPTITVKQILLGVQSLLDEPNCLSPANAPAYTLFEKNPEGYNKKIRGIAKAFAEKE